jgi:GAF domain-containing protein/HAMP domain-containing protein
MTATQTTPVLDPNQKRYKGSLAGTLVRTLLIFTFLPLALMAGTAYFRTRALLREQAGIQSQNLLTSQLRVIDQEVGEKEIQFEKLLKSSDFQILLELALHSDPKSDEFLAIREGILQEFNNLNQQESMPAFDQFLLLDTEGQIKIATDETWQGKTLDPLIFDQKFDKHPSIALYGLSPLYEEELILVTALKYKTEQGTALGSIVGITEKKNLQDLMQPLSGLSSTYLVLSNQQYLQGSPDSNKFSILKSAIESQDKISSTLFDLKTQEGIQPEVVEVESTNNASELFQIQWMPRIQAGAVLKVDLSHTYQNLGSLAPFTILLFMGALIATGLVLVFWTVRIIKPLRSLSQIAHGFADGDWSQRAEVKGDDEVGLLANSFNRMADEVGSLYRSLEQTVDERSRQIRTAAEVAQNVTSLSSLDEVLNKTVELLVQQFGFYQASVFLMDQSGKTLEFKTGFGSATSGLIKRKYRLEVNSDSIIGWVSANNQPRIASDVSEDPIHLKNELLPETRSEASLPISIGHLVLGVLDVQSTQVGAFDDSETVAMLQTLASQTATAIQTAGLTETSQVNFEELSHLYRSSRLIAEANTESEIFEIGSKILKDAPYSVSIFRTINKKLELFSHSNGIKGNIKLPRHNEASLAEIENYLFGGPVIASATENGVPAILVSIMQMLKLDSAAFLPLRKSGELIAFITMGGAQRSLSNATMQPYANLADLMAVTMEKVDAIQQTEKHLREVEALVSINEVVATSSDLQSFFMNLLAKIQQVIGDYSMIVALYNEKDNTIRIPFAYEDGKITSIESFPLGEGLTSILIRTRQPLMIVENTEKRMIEMGAKFSGKPGRSWMGAPMLVQNNPIGALIIQDLEEEHAFDDDDLKFFNTIAGQVAGVIHNVHLLDESQHRALQLETAAEIARDISGSLNLDELLIKAVNFIRERFDFYHASVFLHDLPGEFAVIREATGEAGTQMKRSGYKIGIGSKSIVGYVSSRGEMLVVGDTTKDATYYANPLFPDTRSEAAVPLKVGERILGVLDVQSVHPYAFTEDKLRSLQILADQVAIAVVNTELFAETQEHLSQHRLLHHITTTAASGTTLEEALENAVNGLQVTLGGDRVTILLANREKSMLEVKASMGYAEDVAKVQIPIGSGITGWAAAHKRPLRIKDVTDDPRYIRVSSNTRSELAIPLVYRNELLGVLNVESEQADAYTENDEEMLGTLGGSLAAIIANARLLEQIRVQAERERLIYEVTSKIRRSTDIQSILNTTASELSRLTGAHYTKIRIKPDDTKQENNQ